MLGTRTKQVHSYGKRNQRIVSVSEDSNARPDLAVFPASPNLTQWQRENAAIKPKAKAISPKAIQIPKKKITSPLRRTPRHPRVQEVIDIETISRSRQLKTVKKPRVSDSARAFRQPLAMFSPNVPNSPEVSGKVLTRAGLKGKVASTKAAPIALKKPYSPLVDVDIIVFDKGGKVIAKERRISNTEGRTNGFKIFDNPSVIDLCTSEDEPDSPIPMRRRPKRINCVVISSDESEPELVVKARPLEKPKAVTKKTLEPQKSLVEVVLPVVSRKKQTPFQQPKEPPPEPPTKERYLTPVKPVKQQSILSFGFSSQPRPRPVTPIRKTPFQKRYVPVSPSTPTDLDLSTSFADMSISDLIIQHSPRARADSRQLPPPPAYLLPILKECGQETPYEFSAFIKSFPYDAVVQASGQDATFRKIGEASYSEVFGIGDVVLKIIPLRDELLDEAAFLNEGEGDTPPPSDAKDVLKEIIVTSAIGDICNGFVKLLKAYIVRGRYPEILIDLWDEYMEKKGSESVRPDSLKVTQNYAIIVLPNGGPDLEAFKFSNATKTGWRQAACLFWQVVRTLAQAEELVSFEHRDLHWGQILVKEVPSKLLGAPLRPKSAPMKRLMMDDLAAGIKTTIIDLGLSRMDAGDGQSGAKILWTPFDEEIFMSEGDYQFDIYRYMRNWNEGDWEGFNSMSNIMWLHYLSLKLLHEKRLKAPTRKTPPVSEKSTLFTERDCYDCLLEVEKVLRKCVSVCSVEAKPKGRRKTVAPVKVKPTVPGPRSAGEVLGYGVKRGWVRM